MCNCTRTVNSLKLQLQGGHSDGFFRFKEKWLAKGAVNAFEKYEEAEIMYWKGRNLPRVMVPILEVASSLGKPEECRLSF